MVEIALDQCGPSTERKIALIDKNRDLFLTSVRHLGREPKVCKIGKTSGTKQTSNVCSKSFYTCVSLTVTVCLCLSHRQHGS